MQSPISKITVALPASPRVLIVDDDDAFCRDLGARLETAGLTAASVADLRTATQALNEDPSDILVVDRHLPDGDGFDLCQTIKGNPKTHFIPIIGISGDSAESVRLEAVKAGFDHWLPKPVDVSELVARIHVLVRTTALYRATAAKAEALMLWRDWVRFLVHDLRNPVAVAVGNLAFALRTAPRDLLGEAAEALDEAKVELQRMSSLLQDLLDTDRLKRGLLPASPSTLDLAEVCGATAAAMRGLARRDGKTVVVDVQGRTQVEADRMLIERVCSNLIGNAIRYARKSAVFVAVEGDDQGVTVSVANDGPAIPPDIATRVFEPWIPLDGEVGRGTGLGLAFSRLAVEAHGGSIWIESAEEGNVVFAFRLPRVPR